MRTPGNAPTIVDVMNATGFSRATVSNALNKRGRVNDQTRETIETAAKVLGYRPNRIARALRTSSPRTIAVVMPGWGGAVLMGGYSEFYMRLVGGVTEAAFAQGIHVLLTPQLTSIEDARDLAVDGVIVCDPVGDVDRLGFLRQAGLPIVTYERDPFTDTPPAAISDNTGNIRLLLDHLHEQGAERIALTLPDSVAVGLDEVRASYIRWCSDRGQEPQILPVQPDRAVKEVGEILRASARPDAILDLAYPAAIRAAQAMGIDVPGDLLIATYVDSSELGNSLPAITSMDLRPEVIGAQSVAGLLAALQGEQAPTVVVAGELRVRSSTRRSG